MRTFSPKEDEAKKRAEKLSQFAHDDDSAVAEEALAEEYDFDWPEPLPGVRLGTYVPDGHYGRAKDFNDAIEAELKISALERTYGQT